MSRLFIGLGANLTPEGYNNPREGCEAALVALSEEGIYLEEVSNWYEAAPVPVSDQPWYLNAVALATTEIDAAMTLAALHRDRGAFWPRSGGKKCRSCIGYGFAGFCRETASRSGLTLPHPRMHQRAFVLLPLREICPDWFHPVSGVIVDDLIAQLPSCQQIRLAM